MPWFYGLSDRLRIHDVDETVVLSLEKVSSHWLSQVVFGSEFPDRKVNPSFTRPNQYNSNILQSILFLVYKQR